MEYIRYIVIHLLGTDDKYSKLSKIFLQYKVAGECLFFCTLHFKIHVILITNGSVRWVAILADPNIEEKELYCLSTRRTRSVGSHLG